MRLSSLSVPLAALLLAGVFAPAAYSADWPAWRHDASRSAATSEQLPAELHLQWSRGLPPASPAWPEDVRLGFDASQQPIVVGKSVVVASSRTDSVTAFNTADGKVRWQFFTGGPVRFAPVGSEGKVYFGSDDGRFYCVNAESGRLVWSFSAAPTDRRVIGNDRLISVWPVRGGPAIVDGVVYFTAGVWPFEGTFLYALNAETGEPTGDGLPTSLKDLAPQGYLAVADGKLFVPCGRANTACFDLKTRAPLRLSYSSKGTTDWHIASDGRWFFHGGKVVDTQTNQMLPLAATRPVASGEKIYFSDKGFARAFDLKNLQERETRDRKGNVVKIRVPTPLWRLAEPPVTKIHLKAGDRIYGSRDGEIVAIDLPKTETEDPRVSWKTTIDGTPRSMLAADGRLFVVDDSGTLHCYGAEKTEPAAFAARSAELQPASDETVARAREMLKRAGDANGYCVVFGADTAGLASELLRQSSMRLIVIDRDEERLDDLRRRMMESELYGSRVTALVGELATFRLPPYLADMVVVDDARSVKDEAVAQQTAQKAFRILRPYGGTACLQLSPESHAVFATAVGQTNLANAKIDRAASLTTLARVGALPGAADWTHEYGDPANSLMSRDKLVKAPLGLLWFGGPSSNGELYYDRHDWGPSLAVIEGRMFIQGPQKMTAVDVYTGRILWQNELADGTSPGRRANWKPTGYHFVAMADGLYLAFPEKCVRLHPATGKQISEFTLDGKDDRWGRIRITGDRLIVPVFQPREGGNPEPKQLLALDRHTGKMLWRKESATAFPLVAVGGGKVVCYEGRLEGLYTGASKDRKGGIPAADEFRSIRALDIASGEELWSRSTPRAASWLAYSEDHDVVVVSNKIGIDAWKGKDGDELWSKTSTGNGFRGHPENYWDKVILLNDRIIDQRGPGKAYNVKSGKPALEVNPITGEDVSWEFTKIGHHCNYAVANEHLMTFRAADAGYCDLASGGTGRLEGFRSGCRNSLIPANGVLNAPNFAHGCSCSYSIFTSLALVNVAESDLWTYSAFEAGNGPVNRVGINFGAPGDRAADDGTMWLDYPNVGGPSPQIAVKIAGKSLEYFRLNPQQVEGDGIHWVSASGVHGVEAVTIPLNVGKPVADAAESRFTVRLHFVETEAKPGQRVFDVSIQGKPAIEQLDIARESGGVLKSLVRTISGVAADSAITVSFLPTSGLASISGIEVIREK